MTSAHQPSSTLGPVTHGQLCYVQIPAPDIPRSAAFYSTLFGWHTNPPEPGFEAPGLIGQWVEDRRVDPGAGPVAWIAVEDIDDALRQAAVHGGQVVAPPYLDDEVRWLATVHDPAGNLIGIVSDARKVTTTEQEEIT